MFINCNAVTHFWKDFTTWLSEVNETDITLNCQDIVFGILEEKKYCINYCILHAKWFIHIKRDSGEVNFIHFINYLKNVITVDKCVSISHNNEKFFVIRLRKILYLIEK